MEQFVLRVRISFEAGNYITQQTGSNVAAAIVIKIESKLFVVEKGLQGMVADAEEENARTQCIVCKSESIRPAFMP